MRELVPILLDYATALFKFTEAIRIKPKKHDLYLQRSSVYRLRSEFQKSLSDASKAIHLSPNSYKGWVCRELALEGLGKPVAACDTHTKAVELLDLYPAIRTPEYILGYRAAFPASLATLLKEWHLKFPSEIPPCSCGVTVPRQEFKVFDRKGKELKYTIFQIHRKPWALYRILVLHGLDGRDRLVASVRYSTLKTFLLAWNGVKNGFETEVSAVRIFGGSYEEIRFHRDVFRSAPENPRPAREMHNSTASSDAPLSSRLYSSVWRSLPNEREGQSTMDVLISANKSRDAPVTRQPKTAVRKILYSIASTKAPPSRRLGSSLLDRCLRILGKYSSMTNASTPATKSNDVPENSRPREATRKIPNSITFAEAQLSTGTDIPATEQSRPSTANAPTPDESPNLSSSCSDSESTESSDSEDEKPPAKKIKTEIPHPSSIPIDLTSEPSPEVGGVAASSRETEVVFKFISEQLDMACLIPIAECNDSKTLFTKARKFFQVFNKDVEVSLLSWRLPSQQKQRCFFESSDGQFELLVKDIHALTRGNQRLTVDVKYVA